MDTDVVVCTYCGERADTTDHVIPQAFGGADLPENLVPSCGSCNSRKGSLPVEVFRMPERQRSQWLKSRGWQRLGGNSWRHPDEGSAFFTKAAALRQEGFVRSGISVVGVVNGAEFLAPDPDELDAPEARMRDCAGSIKMDAPRGIVGRWFHSLEWNEDEQRKVVTWQGQIVDRDPDGFYIAQLYSWWDGSESNQVIVPRDRITDWLFYETDEDMRWSADYGPARGQRYRGGQ